MKSEVLWSSVLEVDSATSVQNLKEAVCISYSSNNLVNVMSQTVGK